MSKARDLADLPKGDGDLTVDGDLITNGKVGIGTSSPSGALDVIRNSDDAVLNVRGLGDTIIRARQMDDTGVGYFSFGDSSDIYVGGMAYDHNNDNMRFSVNNSERMRITSAGNTLIGTTTDNGVDKLQVNGSIKASNYNAAFVDNTAFTGNTLTISPLSLGIPAVGVLEFSVNIGVNNSGSYAERSVVVIVNFSFAYPQYGFNNSHTVICNMGRNETTTAPSITVATTRATSAGANNGTLVLTLGSTYSVQRYSCQVRRLVNTVSY